LFTFFHSQAKREPGQETSSAGGDAGQVEGPQQEGRHEQAQEGPVERQLELGDRLGRARKGLL